MKPKRIVEIERRVDSAFNSDTFKEDSAEGKDIRMMEDMLNYIKILNIATATYELYLQDVERETQGRINFADWAYENGNCGVY